MATWQPPIPAGALYSKPARALGPALALLAYCYDLVQRDGWLELHLNDAAGDMEESYQNVKRWWWALKDGPFFSQVEDHGRKGWRVRFKDVWIDWRILNARTTEDKFSRSDEGTNVNLENEQETDNDAQGQLKVNSRSDEGTEMDLETSGNKVLMTTDQACLDDAQKARASPSTRKTKEPTPKPIREAIAGVCTIGKISTREQQLQINQSASQIWKEQEAQGVEQTVADIRYVAAYCKKQIYPFTEGQPVTPAAIRKRWGAAMAARNANGSAGPPPYQPRDHKPTDTKRLAELRAKARESGK